MESPVIAVTIEKKLKQARLSFQSKTSKIDSTGTELPSKKEETVTITIGDNDGGSKDDNSGSPENPMKRCSDDVINELPMKKMKLSVKDKLAKFAKPSGEIKDDEVEIIDEKALDSEKNDDKKVVDVLPVEENNVLMEVDSVTEEKKEISIVTIDSPKREGDSSTEDEVKTPSSTKKSLPRIKTPKQAEKEAEKVKRREEKEKNRQEAERKRQLDKEEKQKLKEERKLQKQKELEEKEEQKRKLREEKEMMKKKEIEEKEEQKRKMKEDKEKKRQQEIELKNEEKRRKDEEKRKKEEEQQKKKDEGSNKFAKEAEAFSSFFTRVESSSKLQQLEKAEIAVAFEPFMVKTGMRLAPLARATLAEDKKLELDQMLSEQTVMETYITQLRCGEIRPGQCGNTWPLEERYQDDIVVLDLDLPEASTVSCVQKPQQPRPKLIQFHENRRPPYWGTWRKKCSDVGPRKPFGQYKSFEYDVDSDDEWEEEEPGESLHGSDDEKEQEEEDDYDIDNDFFVPHGYLSEDEDQEQECWSPEQQKAKLKLLGEQFDQERNEKTRQLRPIVLGCIWFSQDPPKAHDKIIALLSARAAVPWVEELPISTTILKEDDGDTNEGNDIDVSPKTTTKKVPFDPELTPKLIELIHGSHTRRKWLSREFLAYCAREYPTAHQTSMAAVGRKIKELAQWQECPEPPIQGRFCWYVSREVREQNGCSELSLPNTWEYITTTDRKRASGGGEDAPKILKFTKVLTEEERKQLLAADPEVVEVPTDKSPVISKITKYTKVLSEDERRQLLIGDAESPSSGEKLTPMSKITRYTKVLSEEERRQLLDQDKEQFTPGDGKKIGTYKMTPYPKSFKDRDVSEIKSPVSSTLVKAKEKLSRFRANTSKNMASKFLIGVAEEAHCNGSVQPDGLKSNVKSDGPVVKKRVALLSSEPLSSSGLDRKRVLSETSIIVEDQSAPIKKRAVLLSSEPLSNNFNPTVVKKRAVLISSEPLHKKVDTNTNGLSTKKAESEKPKKRAVLISSEPLNKQRHDVSVSNNKEAGSTQDQKIDAVVAIGEDCQLMKDKTENCDLNKTGAEVSLKDRTVLIDTTTLLKKSTECSSIETKSDLLQNETEISSTTKDD